MQEAPSTSISYAKSYYVEQSELLYKMLKNDSKLIKSTLNCKGFKHTDGHEWNILWMNFSGKSYLYEGLNEY